MLRRSNSYSLKNNGFVRNFGSLDENLTGEFLKFGDSRIMQN
jgi:hypothetical protein